MALQNNQIRINIHKILMCKKYINNYTILLEIEVDLPS